TPSTTATVCRVVFYYISQTEKRSMRFMKPVIDDRRIVAVYVDEEGRAERVANYGLQAGVGFAFIGRNTPTTGVEEARVQQSLALISFWSVGDQPVLEGVTAATRRLHAWRNTSPSVAKMTPSTRRSIRAAV